MTTHDHLTPDAGAAERSTGADPNPVSLQSASARPPRDPALVVVAILLAVVAGATTILWGRSMSAAHGMRMPGGWTMSMAWMRMAGQTWLEAAAIFLGMWSVMMVPMMLPSFVPMLARYRRALDDRKRIGRLSTLAAAGYFAVWIALGALVYPVGAALAAAAMRHRVLSGGVPLAASLVVATAGALQLTRWKARRLACCRQAAAHGHAISTTSANAWRHGLLLGVECVRCCIPPTAVLLTLGVMDLRVMALVTAAVTGERLAPQGAAVARATGALGLAAGLYGVARALQNV